jgi:hypothetical protein
MAIINALLLSPIQGAAKEVVVSYMTKQVRLFPVLLNLHINTALQSDEQV